MKKKGIILASVIIGIFVIFLFSGQAWAFRAGDLLDMEIIGHHFTSQITGKNIDDEVLRIWVKNPSNFRYLVLKIKARKKKDDFILWGSNFVLSFIYQKKYCVHKLCKGISFGDENGKMRAFKLDKEMFIRVRDSEKYLYFGLAFFVPNSVNEIKLERVGTGQSVPYFLPDERPYSVYVVTNSNSRKMMDELRGLLESGGYQVTSSHSLVEGEKGITIMYVPKADNAAREISQRIMTRYRKISNCKEMSLIAEYDIVVWVGKDVFNNL